MIQQILIIIAIMIVGYSIGMIVCNDIYTSVMMCFPLGLGVGVCIFYVALAAQIKLPVAIFGSLLLLIIVYSNRKGTFSDLNKDCLWLVGFTIAALVVAAYLINVGVSMLYTSDSFSFEGIGRKISLYKLDWLLEKDSCGG